MSELSVTKISGVTEISTNLPEVQAANQTANAANQTANAANQTANAANQTANAALDVANSIGSTATAAFNKANNALPPGTIVEKVWNTTDPIPTGFLRMDSNVYFREAYSDLSTVLGEPIRMGNYTKVFQNTILQVSDVFQSNDVLFHAGTNTVGSISNQSYEIAHDLSSAANTIIYSRDGGISWTSAAAMGFNMINTVYNRDNLAISNRRMVASNGTGTYVITNGSATSGTIAAIQNGNAYIMAATSENLNSWTKVVLTSGAAGGTGSGSINGADGGSSAYSISFGGTQNRFVLLFSGGSNFVAGVCDTSTGTNKASRIAWSNNGTTWTFQPPGAVGWTQGSYQVNDVLQTAEANRDPWENIEATSNGFVAIRRVSNAPNVRSNTVFTSSDGIIWTDISTTIADAGYDGNWGTSTNSPVRTLSQANGLFIISSASISTAGTIRASTQNSQPFILISNNRTTWSRVNINSFGGGTPFTGRRIFHNGKIYYTSGGNFFNYSTDLANWFRLESNTSTINIVATANVGNTIYGQGAGNTTTDVTGRMTVGSITHNTYNSGNEFPLPNTISNKTVTTNPFLNFESFIKT
jgi:hypothetical protein